MKKISRLCLFVALISFPIVGFSETDPVIDSLLALIRSGKDDTVKAWRLNEVARLYIQKGEFIKARNHAEKGLVIARSAGFRKGMSNSYNYIGVVLKQLGDYPGALKNYFLSLRIREEMRDNKGIANSRNNIANIYYAIGEFDKALENHLAAMDMRKSLGDQTGIATSYNNIANVYTERTDFKKALAYHDSSLAIKKAIGDELGISVSYINIGNVYNYLGDYDMAARMYSMALKMKEEIGDQEGIVSSYINLGSINARKGRITEARTFYNMALSLALKIGSTERCKESYAGLFELDSLEGRYKEAYGHYKQYIFYRDSLVNEENTRKTIQAQMQYEFDKQQAADSVSNVEMVRQDKMRHDLEIRQQRTYTYGGIAGFILMLAAAGVSFLAFRQKQKANAIISLQKRMVEEKQKEMLDSIYYARRIQQSLFPSERYIGNKLFALRKLRN